MRNFKALLIEDDLLFQETLKDFLDDNGICTSVESDGDNGFSTFENENPDIVILDIILPNKSGFEILREIREVNKSVPIILMTGTEFDEQSQILGYELGIVNYLKKPILPQVLLAQIKNLLAIPKDLKVFKIKGSEIVFHKQSVSINNKDIDLREKDSQLLKLLLENESLTLSRSDILLSLWGSDDVQLNNSLDRTILRIRTELKAIKHITIETIYGVGYRLSVC